MVEDEPGPLAEIRALARGLEVQPGLREELVGRGRVGEGLRGVVGGEEVFDYGAGFPEGEGGVWVGDGGDAAVGVEGFEGLCTRWFVVRGNGSLVQKGWNGEMMDLF